MNELRFPAELTSNNHVRATHEGICQHWMEITLYLKQQVMMQYNFG